MDEKDLYQVLGVARKASDDDIRKTYRKLARKYHPDVNPNDKEAEERFKEISFAYDILSDPAKRKLYDEFGMAGLSEGFDPDKARAYRRWSEGTQRSPFSQTFVEGDLGDLFSELFGGRAEGRTPFGRGFRTPRPLRGQDIEGEVTVDFMDAIRGGEVRVRVARSRGPGLPEEESTLKVRIPRGSDEGMRIRLAKQGAPGVSGGPPGDLYLTLHVRPHRFFKREGSNLLLELPVTLPELILGGSVEVPTPDGPVTMRIQPRSQSGQRMRLRGKGVPHRTGEESGDLIVRLIARLPDTEDPELERLAREVEGMYGDADLRKDLKEP
jgi:DnaJ-class molecular chaperone